MSMDWDALLRGFLWGLPVSLLFFAGLAWGMRLALRSTQPASLLLLSSALRIAALLGVGYWVSARANNAWPLAGYTLAFFFIRVLAIARARRVPTPSPSPSTSPSPSRTPATPERGGA